MEKEIKVSICCLVYNHAKYLRQCLDGFVMQKTNFAFEVLIHEDASTDGSADIIREYEAKYPDIIKPIYQTENQYSKGVKIAWTYQYPRAKGKYIALCEGDDYWCDENKLQSQFDAMESEPNASICVCKVQEVTEDGIAKIKSYPQGTVTSGVMNQDEVLHIIYNENNYPFQTSGFFIEKSVILSAIEARPKFITASSVGDVPLLLYSISKGKLVYIDKVMSCYRTGGSGSWNARQTVTTRINNYLSGIAMLSLYEIYTNHAYSHIIGKMIDRENYYYYYLKKDYSRIIRKEYREWFKKEPIKQRVYCYLSAKIPHFTELYRRVRGRK